MTSRSAQRGVTLLEVLVALLILLIGLLGLAGLLVATQQSEMESYQRKQAMVLVQDMIDRLTSNPVAASCYAITAASGTPTLGADYAGGIVCGAGSDEQRKRADADVQAWHEALLGTSEKTAANASVGSIIEARGCVTNPTPGEYVVSVAWRGLASTFAPPAAFTCGTGLYKVNGVADDSVRRVLSITVRIGDLKA